MPPIPTPATIVVTHLPRTTTASELISATLYALEVQPDNTTEEFLANRTEHYQYFPNMSGHTHHTAFSTSAPIPDRDDVIDNAFVQLFFCLLYSTVFILGIFGNVLVCYVVIRNRAMQTVTNIFITNLALSDILLCGLAVPFTPVYTFMGRWAFGRTMCHLVPFAQGCSIYISTLTLTSIAVDRYFVIIYPFHPRMKLSTCIAIILSIWIISVLATLPYGMYVKIFSEETAITYDAYNLTIIDLTPPDNIGSTLPTPLTFPDDITHLPLNFTSSSNITYTAPLNFTTSGNISPLNLTTSGNISYVAPLNFTISGNISYAAQRNFDAHMQVVNTNINAVTESPPEHHSNPIYCEENWPSERYRKVFGSVTSIFQFVLPFIIISVCYIWISHKLNARAKAKPGSKSSRKEEADRDRKKRTNRMLICMVAVFGLSWLPINMVNIFDDFYIKSNEWRYYTLLFFVAHAIAMSSTCYNPFLYAWLNENFRKEFKTCLPCFNYSNNNIINIARGFNRSDRNTCGPRLHPGNGGGCGGCGGGNGNGGTATRGSSLDNDEQDNGNAITQNKADTILIIPREPTFGNGNSACSPCLERGLSSSLEHCSKQVEILLNDNDIRRHKNHHHRNSRHRYDDDLDSGDEQTVEMRFTETPFISSDNTTGISIMEISNERSGSSEREFRCN